MSEQDNVEQIERIFEAFGRGDIPYIIDHLTEDVRWVSRLEPVVPWAGDYSGKANVPRFFEALGGSAEVTAHPVNQLVAQGDTVVATGEVSFRARDTGKSSSSRWVYIWKLRDDQVSSYEQFNDPGLAEAFR
jgi:ketosteroid isomerase-like protein